MAFSFLDPFLGPLFRLPSFLALLIFSLLVSLLITLIYKYTTNQSLMKQLKGEIKEFQKEMKELKDKPGEVMRVQKEAMKTNLKYMSMSMKSTLITFIPIIFIFGWMNTHLAFEPIQQGDQFSTTVHFTRPMADGQVSLKVPDGLSIDGSATKDISGDSIIFTLKAGKEGTYTLDYIYKGQSYLQEVIVTSERAYADRLVKTTVKDSDIKSLEINYQKHIVLNLLGWKMGWLAVYIILSIAFSLGLRKLMKVY
ncbi:TPA: DUF106 domain-containing protein [Candidatus Woesearchaeota archaeon]|nr:DUF106 domain-containing protein [Candidatus Woesearchaeota archaeon]